MCLIDHGESDDALGLVFDKWQLGVADADLLHGDSPVVVKKCLGASSAQVGGVIWIFAPAQTSPD